MADWNDLKYLLQVARDGSTLAASRSLRTNQTTVMRRVAAVEAELALTLFEKRRSGYVATDALRQLMPQLEAVARAHEVFDHEASALTRNVGGTIRLTAPELVIQPLMVPALTALREHHPAIRVDLVTTDAFLDLSKGEADIALRASDRPSANGLLGRRIYGTESWSVCCSRDYAKRNGMPRGVEDLADHTLVGVMEGLYPSVIMDWLDAYITRDSMALRQNSLIGIYAAVRSGFGVTVAPDVVLLADTDMIRCFPVGVEEDKELWLLTHERHRDTPHVRAAMDFLGTFLSGLVKSRIRQAEEADRSAE